MPKAVRRIEPRNAVLHIYDEDLPLGKTRAWSSGTSIDRQAAFQRPPGGLGRQHGRGTFPLPWPALPEHAQQSMRSP